MTVQQVGVNLKDPAFFKVFFHENYPKVVGVAWRYLQDRALSADVAQECFVRLWYSEAKFVSVEKILGFLYTTARHLSLDHIKHSDVVAAHIEKTSSQSEYFFQDAVTEEETYELVYRAIDRLAPQSRKVILYTLEGRSNAEIAQLLHITVNSVRTHKQNAYKKLRSMLQQNFIFFLLLQKSNFF